ncbi:helix-turn-helix transcriptional regulator [Emticicia sp. W12TSBA100-4]|uniref:helix-turn-helix domain-containing protein n=1 Tax=Emticicia sp. W12TSBA100-4 TaxID=3160965 RepID=UPI003305B151
MATSLDNQLLASMIKAKRGKMGLRQAAIEIGGVSSATLSRIELGNTPDVDTFIKICNWLGEKTDTFIIQQDENDTSGNNQQRIVAHLRSEKQLRPDTIEMLLKVIEIAYSQN